MKHLPFTAVVLALVAAPSQAQVAQVAPALGANETLLEVVSEGEAYAAPDRATVTAGVTTLAPTAVEAASANAGKMTALVAALRTAGVAAAETRTSMVRLNPNTTYDPVTGPRITGYTASNQLTIELRDPRRVSNVVTAAFGGGANTVNGPNFTLSRNGGAIAAARTDAVRHAREQAEAYAAAFGMKIVRVIRISERGQQSVYTPIVVTGSRMAPPPPPPPPPPGFDAPIETGQVRQSVNLWVDYALAPN